MRGLFVGVRLFGPLVGVPARAWEGNPAQQIRGDPIVVNETHADVGVSSLFGKGAY